MAKVYDRRTLFILKLSKNMGRLTDEERAVAMQSFPEDVQESVRKMIELARKHKK